MRRTWGVAIAAALLATTLTGCGGGEAGGWTGAVDIDGSSTVFQISQAAREAYDREHPEVTVVVDNHGTGGGFNNYLKGEVDIVDASRPAKPDEEARAKAQGIDWTRFVVGYDGITVAVHPSNDFVKSLSVAQLKAIWQSGSRVKTWKDVDPSWPDRPIVLYSPDDSSGTFEYFAEAILGKSNHQRDDVQANSDDNTLVSGVAGDRDSLGYFGFAYYEANRDKLRAVPIQAGPDAAPVLPAPATILDKSYRPLSRPLFIYVKNSSIRRAEVYGFLRFYLDNIEALATKGGYVPPTADDRAANQQALASRRGTPPPPKGAS